MTRAIPNRFLVSFDDPVALAIGILRDVLVGQATIAGRLPSNKAAALAALPLVVVLSNGSTDVQSSIATDTTLRLTVYDDDEDRAFDTCGLAQQALNINGRGHLGRCIPLTGPWTTVDPDTELFLATATSRARVQSVAADL